ncbi:MAG: carbon-nitrogen hydrolase family protein, partial [Candidatus Dormibacteria bacterium]
MRSPLVVAAAQPVCVAGDLQANAAEHARAIQAARDRLLVFPELSLTGYELEAEPVSPTDGLLAPIVKARAATGTVALVGAPVSGAYGDLHIGMPLVDPSGVAVVHHKSWLGPAETGRFKPGDGARAIDVDGWRVGLGICKDTGVGP